MARITGLLGKIKINWTAIAALAAVAAAIFAGLTWREASNTLDYTLRREAPDLYLKTDRFIYGDFEISDKTEWNTPRNIPSNSVVLKQYPMIETITGNKYNRRCLIMNSSNKHSSSSPIANYSGLFGELHLQNRGDVVITRIEIAECRFVMRNDTGFGLEDFSLEPSGYLDVDIGRDSPLILYIGYLYDNDSHMLCNPQYVVNGVLDSGAMEKKRMFDDQLRVYLPVIIDLFEEMSITFRLTTQDGRVYLQTSTMRVLERDMNGGGMYVPDTPPAQLVQ